MLQQNRKKNGNKPVLRSVAVCATVLLAGSTLIYGTYFASKVLGYGELREADSPTAPKVSVAAAYTIANEADAALTTAEEPSTAVEAPAKDDWRLVLVNSKNRLEQDYDVTLAEVAGYKVDERITEDLNAMLAAAKADGYTLKLYSAYRPMERSRVLYNGKVNEYIAAGYSRTAAEKEAARWIAPPGTSEHNTGLAVDIISGDYFTKFRDLVHDFDTCPEFTWLYTHCAEYGFVLRYPKDKQETTGITYEPWHYRYVGREAAKEMMEQKVCLEEYLAQ